MDQLPQSFEELVPVVERKIGRKLRNANERELVQVGAAGLCALETRQDALDSLEQGRRGYNLASMYGKADIALAMIETFEGDPWREIEEMLQ